MEYPSKLMQCWCFKKKKPEDDYDLQPFWDKNLPIFCVIGPPGCGKTTLAEMLAKSSKYHLLKITNLLKEDVGKGRSRGRTISEYIEQGQNIPDIIVVNLLKEAFIQTFENCIGYIIDGFPTTLQQAKLFEKQICKISLFIYVTLILDALLARKITQVGAFDPNDERIIYIEHTKRLNEITKKYDQKSIKLHANYPPEDTCTRLVENLEDYWGYKFLRLYNKNQ